MLAHDSIAEIDETKLVKLLLADPYRREGVVRLYGIPNDAAHFQNVPLVGIPGDVRGDVDILLCSPHRPDLATAIEVKRVKVGWDEICSGQPSKLGRLKKAVGQANKLAGIGFSQVYLYVFVVVDSREQNGGEYSFEGASMELKDVIQCEVSKRLGDLVPRVGLLQCEFTQPMDSTPLEEGASGLRLVRSATRVEQTPELTEWVRQTIARKCQI
jgi:hypothetical protein